MCGLKFDSCCHYSDIEVDLIIGLVHLQHAYLQSRYAYFLPKYIWKVETGFVIYRPYQCFSAIVQQNFDKTPLFLIPDLVQCVVKCGQHCSIVEFEQSAIYCNLRQTTLVETHIEPYGLFVLEVSVKAVIQESKIQNKLNLQRTKICVTCLSDFLAKVNVVQSFSFHTFFLF